MFTFRHDRFSEVSLNIKHFPKYVRHELYMRYVNIREMIDTTKFHVRTHTSYREFDNFNEGDGHRTDRDDRNIFVESATKARPHPQFHWDEATINPVRLHEFKVNFDQLG